MSAEAFPLYWPDGWPRTKSRGRAPYSYRELARQHHPDASKGDAGAMAMINRAYEQFQKERGL